MRDSFRTCGLVATIALTLVAAPLRAETRALLAGSWLFQSPGLHNLDGPPSDLAAMEGLIRRQGATDVTVLRNEGMTRTTFETALHALGLRSKPGDWIFVFYSGHGAEADAAIKGTADGDTDQFLPLSHFSETDPEQYIVDKDLYAWVSRYIPSSVQVLIVADTCHSGTLHRSIDPRGRMRKTRLATREGGGDFALTARPGPRFPGIIDKGGDTRGIAIQRSELPNEIFIGAAQDAEVATEDALPLPQSKPRGFLTYAFEHGLTDPSPDGKTVVADANGDGKVSVGEIAQYLTTQVVALSADLQHPSAHYVSSLDKMPLFESVVRPTAPLATATPLPGVFVLGARPAALAPAGYRLVENKAVASYIWDTGTHEVVRASGDVVAQGVATDGALAAVVEKWSAVEALRPLLSEGSGRVTIGPATDGSRYRAGERVSVGLDTAPTGTTRYATVFNLAADGTVQPLYPLAADGDGHVLPGDKLTLLETRVTAPFGADHIVALLTPAPPTQFRQLLTAAQNQRAAARIVPALRAAMGPDGRQGSLSIGQLYSGK